MTLEKQLVNKLFYFTIFLIFLAIIPPVRTEAADLSVAVVMGFNIGPYLESRDAFIERLNPSKAETFYLNNRSPKEIQWEIQRKHFSLVYVIGESALVFAINYLPDSKIVFSSVLNPSRYIQASRNHIRGISAMIPARLYLQFLKIISYDTANGVIQTITTPEVIPDLFPEGVSSNDHLNLIHNTDEAFKFLLAPDMKRNIVLTAPVAATLDKTFILSAIKASINTGTIFPGHSKIMTEMGCLFSLAADPVMDGKKAAKMILNDERGIIYYSDLEQVNVTINLKAAEVLRIEIPEEILKKAKAVY